MAKSSDEKNAAAQEAADKAKHSRAAEEKAASTKASYKVAKGKSLTTCRGVVGEGSPVTALDFCRTADQESSGQAVLNELLSKGYLEKV